MTTHAMTPGMSRVLDLLAEAEAGNGTDGDEADASEIVCDGLACWIGTERTNRQVVALLLRYLLVTVVSDEGGVDRFALTDTGRAARRRPELLGEIANALAGAGGFTIVDDRVLTLG